MGLFIWEFNIWVLFYYWKSFTVSTQLLLGWYFGLSFRTRMRSARMWRSAWLVILNLNSTWRRMIASAYSLRYFIFFDLFFSGKSWINFSILSDINLFNQKSEVRTERKRFSCIYLYKIRTQSFRFLITWIRKKW